MICFREQAWADYLHWQQVDRRMLKRISMLIREIERTPFAGLGKPEPLKHDLAGLWSRRIDDEHRSVYTFLDGDLVIVQCPYHY